MKEAAGVLTAVAVAVAGATAAVRVYGVAPRPASHRPAAPTVYVAYDQGSRATRYAIIPIDTATNRAGKPIRVGFGFQIAITPDGKTAYALDPNTFTVIPISTATNTAGKPIPVGHSRIDSPSFIAITPDGKTVYVANTGRNTVVPISTATNTAGKPIPVASGPEAIAITPDGKIAYVVSSPTSGNGPATVTPISTATNTPGKPIPVGPAAFEIVVTPDGKTAYASSGSTVTPIDTATNTAGPPIRLHGNFGEGAIAITPDGKTLYALTINPDAVVPISTATNTAGTPIKVHLFPSGGIPMFAALAATQFVITPDGKTAYLGTGGDSVIPISTATNAVGKTIGFGADCRSQRLVHPNIGIAITPDSKTAYVACESAVIPISTATNTPGTPIHIPLRDPDGIAITP